MYELLAELPSGARVLDLGSGEGSFPKSHCPQAVIVRLDLEGDGGNTGSFVRGDAAHLPFPDHCFDAVISNHSLEHMTEVGAVCQEVGRVLKPSGWFYASVPDASTLSDRLYRWVYHGGGHVNLFRSVDQLISLVKHSTGLSCIARRTLYTSFGFLRREHFLPRPPRRMWLLANGAPTAIAFLSYTTRRLDRILGTRLGVYGWAVYFGCLNHDVTLDTWTNVCAGCGAAFSADWLLAARLVRRSLLRPTSYACPSCGASNYFTNDATLPGPHA